MLGRKVIYVRYLSCSYNNVAKGIRLLEKNQFLFIQENFHSSKSFLKIYPLKHLQGILYQLLFFSLFNKIDIYVQSI